MDFGSLPIGSHFDSSLAPLHPASVILLNRKKTSSQSLNVYLGAPQFNIPQISSKLSQYIKHWKSIEFNSSFYQIPSQEQVRKWQSEVNEEFRFAIKLHRSLSHEFGSWLNKQSSPSFEENLSKWISAWKELGLNHRLSFLQLPPHFGFEHLPKLQHWILTWNYLSKKLETGSQLMVEFRHPSWFIQRQLKSEVARVLAQNQVGSICSDTPGEREVSHGTITLPCLMVRFLGQSTSSLQKPHSQDLERISLWVQQLLELSKQGLHECYFYLHTPDHSWLKELSGYIVNAFKESDIQVHTQPKTQTQSEQLGLF